MTGISRRIYQYAACCLGLMVFSAATLFGQGTSGTIKGVVTDPTGAVVPSAVVTVTDEATGTKVVTKTTGAGLYSVTSLIPGTYTLEVRAAGFRNYVNRGITLTVDQVLGVNVTLEVGSSTQSVTVEAAAPVVNTEEGRMSALVTSQQVQSMPLNGRNVYQLMQLIPGAVNSTGIDMESTTGGIQTNVNGSRANFNGFLYDGVANKGLSGGSNAQPAPDFIQEFRIETNNFDAQYSNSAASITDVSTKSGTNNFHGDAWEYLRNDKLNARNFFDGATKAPWKLNQFGGTIGGPIKKDKLFFFAGYEGERFRTAVPTQQFIESPDFRSGVIAADPNSVAALLYNSFSSPNPVFNTTTVDQQVLANITNPSGDYAQTVGQPYAGLTGTNLSDAYLGYIDPCFAANVAGVGINAGVASLPGLTWGNPQTVANRSAALFGVTPAENAQIAHNIAVGCPGSGLVAPAVQNGTLSRSAIMNGFVNIAVPTEATGVFFNGDQYVGRMDYQGDKDRMFGRFYYLLQKNPNVNATSLASPRGFIAPSTNSFPGAAFGWVRNLSSTMVNEFDAGFIRNQLSDIPNPAQFGVPEIDFDTGEPSFGAYNGYPQFFNENVFNFKDMVSMTRGAHSLKYGAEFKRNYENSEFNVGRPDYAMFDPVYFAADLPYIEAAGVNPELVSGGSAHLDTNIRAWRNYEVGLFIQDDWKVKRNFTLNLGLRWDFFSPHTEKYNHATQLVLGPGSNQTDKLASINCEAFLSSGCLLPVGDTNTPNGGFTRASSLFPDRWTDFAPRVGVAWDPKGDGKMSVRAGAAISYEGTFYNALSNSRWNLPFYSFNEAGPILGLNGLPTYGPTNPDGTPNTSVAPTFSGAPSNVGPGPAGLGFAGNIQGWLPANPDLAHLTGIPSRNYKLPYIEQFFLGVQRQLSPSTVVEVNGVATLGRHLFWAEDPNRVVGGKQNDVGQFDPCTGQTVPNTPLLNPCFGIMRTWETSVNSSYEALQVSVNKRFTHGLAFTTNYTWAHSIDLRSTWHALTSGGSATDANAAGEAGYSLDPNRLFLERGNSLFDIRHRVVGTVQWDLPWMKSQQGLAGHVLGGWSVNTLVSLQTGFPFTVSAHKDFNGTGIRGQRPDVPSFGNHMYFSRCDFESGCASSGGMAAIAGDFPTPAPGTDGTLGRNTFRGPGFADTDFSLFKKIPLGSNESRYFEFRAEFFNLLNRTNLFPPDANLTSNTFGLSTQAFDPREIQFGLKFFF